jgi:hypothetical protein
VLSCEVGACHLFAFITSDIRTNSSSYASITKRDGPSRGNAQELAALNVGVSRVGISVEVVALLLRIEPRLVRRVFRAPGHAVAEDSAPVRQYTPEAPRRIVALEPREPQMNNAIAPSSVLTATLGIFHGRHYSRVEVHAEQPRPLLADQATASADQLRAVWGPFIGEAGVFELSGDNVITMRASVAKNPAAMMSGASSVYLYRRDGDVLTLTQLRTHAGPSPNPITIKLTRVE